ncbi:MAG: glycosyltransferase family 2 protein [Nitrospira sp.]|nr:glycosyltransferase family 2 protein [Nitrospira sp.]
MNARVSASPLTVAVIVPVYNGGERFHASLKSIRQTVPPPDELIVIGDGDTDGSSQYAEAAGVTLYRFPQPGGPGRARNLGASKATSDLLFFIDADVTVPEKAIEQVRDIFARHPEIAAMIGSYDDQPGEANFLSQYRNLLHHYVHQNGREEASTFWGACGAIRREVFLAMGGFDETYRKPSIEDIELGYRLTRAGHRIRLCKSIQVKHWKRWTIGSMLQADFFQRAVPWTQLIHRHQGFVNDLNIGISGRVSVMLAAGLLGALMLSPWQPLFLVGAAMMGVMLFSLNARLYRFFLEKRGLRFAAQTVPWHWLYFLYSGVAFAVGTVCYFAKGEGELRGPASLVTQDARRARSRVEKRE